MNKKVLQKLSYGVYVVSSLNENNSTGCVSNAVMQVTHSTLAVSLNHENFTNECIKKSKKFAVSILPENVDISVIGVFGFKSGRDFDKFSTVKSKNVDGISVLENSCGYIICNLIDTLETETHTIFLGEIVEGDILNETEEPMTYSYYHKVKKGVSPEKAPTYIEPEKEESEKLRYKCGVCGYVYEGDITLEPESYKCPICSQPKSVFEKI